MMLDIEAYCNWGTNKNSYSLYQLVWHFREKAGGWDVEGYFF